MRLAQSVLLLPLLWIIVLADTKGETLIKVIELTPEGKNYQTFIRNLGDRGILKKFSITTSRSFMVQCEESRGVCIQVAACPYNRVLTDAEDICVEYASDYACCRVAQVRMPDLPDMFENL